MSGESRHSLGDLVVVHDPRLARQLGRQDQLGVVINTRRGGARTLFLPDRSTFWIDDHRLYPHPAPEELGPPALLRIGAALSILDAEEAELESVTDDGTLVLQALGLRFGDAHPGRLSEVLGDALVGWDVIPYGMALITVVVKLRGD